MRELFDRRLTDPTAEEVAEALRAAVAAVNAKHRRGNLPAVESGVEALAARVESEPEGRYGAVGTPGADHADVGRLVLAWWTNAGRKFARVRGWRGPDRRGDPFASGWHNSAAGLAFHEAQRDLAARPAVWHVDHERVVETHTGGEPEWVAVCGCGAAGSPASLGWQHGMCGPCADRIAEFGPDAVTHAPGLLNTPGQPTHVLFTPDGQFVVATGEEWYRVWGTESGALKASTVYPGGDADLHPTASLDGRHVFLGIESRIWPLLALPEGELWLHESLPSGGVRAAFWTGRPDELLVQTLEHGDTNLHCVRDGQVRPGAEPPDPGGQLYAVGPDAVAPRAVFAVGHRASVARVNPDGTLAVEARFLLGDGRLNRTGLWQGGPEIVRFTPDGERLLFVRGSEMELRLSSRPKALLQAEFPRPIADAAFSPDYEHLYLLTDDGAVHVCNPGTLTSVRARLRWHVGGASRLAVSPDGATLATAGPEGVKLWPVARLLPLLG